MPSVRFYYRVPKNEVPSQFNAAIRARTLLLEMWKPSHWHLDEVSDATEFYSVTFHANVDDAEWSSNEDDFSYGGPF